MKILRKLGAIVTLTFVLCLSAFGQTCTDPGETHGPPCSASPLVSGETATATLAPGQTDTPPSAELSLTEIASIALLSMMSLF
jgi:hypothetical protein